MAAPTRPGRIPFTLRIGVTGHRHFDEKAMEELRAPVRDALARIRELFPSTDEASVEFSAVSALAEGADRLVAHVILDETPGGSLEVPLPLPVADYMTDFHSSASKADFKHLLQRAHLVIEAPATDSRDQAYQRSGRYVADRSDVLVALWDGKRERGTGGTAQIIRYALESRTPVIVVPVRGGDLVVDLGHGGIAPEFGATGAQRPSTPQEGDPGFDILPIEATCQALRNLKQPGGPL